MFDIKICGITNAIDAIACSKFGADAIGLNFHQSSLRSVTIEQAQQIVSELRLDQNEFELQSTHAIRPTQIVGVFVTDSANDITLIAEQCQLDMVQLHGDQPLEIMDELSTHRWPVIRAIPWMSLEQVHRDSIQWIDKGVSSILLDSEGPSLGFNDFGGTGQAIDWIGAAQLALSVPIVLAGGLEPGNVIEAINTSKIRRVDVASGIESLPGKKDHSLLQSFLENSRFAISRP